MLFFCQDPGRRHAGNARQQHAEAALRLLQRMRANLRRARDLLAEFAKVADELKKILGDLEGSTFVKRLKAAARRD